MIRRSLYKHLFATPGKKDQQYDNLKVSTKSETLVRGNCTFFAVPWDSAGGAALAIFPYSKTGRIDPRHPLHLIRGHTQAILDFDFDPFDEHIVATGSEDTRVRVFAVPDGGLTADLEEALVTLGGHERKVHIVNYHPTAKNVLLSASQDNTVRLWDLAAGQEKINIADAHSDNIFSTSFNYDGSLLATTARDQQLRVIDIRAGKVTANVECHESNKPTRVTWLGNKGRIFTTGFNKRGERQFAIWDEKNLSAPLHVETLELSPAQLQPFYDEDTSVMYLAGKGEAGIRYYEMIDEAPYNFFLSEYKATTPQKGLTILPKRICDVRACEIDRFLKLSNQMIEPLFFTVPRKSEVFQTDIFPETRAPEPPLTADQFFAGQTAAPKLISLKPEGVAAMSVSAASASRLSTVGRPSNPGPAPVTSSSSSGSQPTPVTSTSSAQHHAPATSSPLGGDRTLKNLADDNDRCVKQIAVLEKKIAECTDGIASLKTQVEANSKKIQDLQAKQASQ